MHRPRKYTHRKIRTNMLSPLLHAYLHVLIPSKQRIALSFQDTCDAYIHVGQGPEDYVVYYCQPPPMSRFKPFPSMVVAVASLTMSPVQSCQGPVSGEEGHK